MKIPVKYKGLIYLATLLIVVPWFAWHMSIAGNIDMAGQTRRFEKEAAGLKAKSEQVRTSPAAIAADGGTLQSGGLIPVVMDSEAGARCKVVKYSPYITESRDGLAVHTAELVISGTYTDLLRLVSKAEGDAGDCRLVSTTFRIIRGRQKSEAQLHMTMIFQQITKTA